MNEAAGNRMLVRQRLRAVAEEPQQVAGAVIRTAYQAARDPGPHPMQLKFEGGSHTEVAAAAADGPEQIGLFFFARAHCLARSGDKFDGPDVVEGEAIFAHQPAQSATQREPGDTRTRNDPARDRETVQLRLAIEFGPGNSTLNTRCSAFGVNMNTFHGCQVDHYSAVDGRAARHVVTPAANRHLQT